MPLDATLAPTREMPLVPPEAEAFYAETLRLLMQSGIPFLLAGTYAVNAYTGIHRATKDLDVFCRAGDYPKILCYFQDRGYATEIEDERWIAKVTKDAQFFDIIFNSSTAVAPVNDAWFADARNTVVYGTEVKILSPTELIWSKVFIQDRHKYDGSDVSHVILKQSDNIDWKRLLGYMDQYWEILFAHLLNFRFVYPSERGRVPLWLLGELTERLKQQAELPIPQTAVCRGRLLSPFDYCVDNEEWGYVGEGEWKRE